MVKIGLKTWIINKLMGSGVQETKEVDWAAFFNLEAELYFRKLAFETAINLIANSVSKCEFRTFRKNKEEKGREYYRWNIEPNKNENSSQFLHKLISKLYKENECLVIVVNNQLLVADSFIPTEYALINNQFAQVTVGDFQFNKTFFMDEVLYFKLNNKDIKKLIDGMYTSYGKLIAYAQKSFLNSRGEKGILDIDSLAEGKENFAETFEALMNDRFKKYFQSENAVLPLFQGYKYTPNEKKTYSQEGSRDIKSLVDDIYDFTARAFGIPPALLRGEMVSSGDLVDVYLTFCIDPLCDMLQEEINRKINGYTGLSQGNYLKINTKAIKHIDLLNVSTAIDKLISSGAFTINDIRRLVDEEKVKEEFADKHFITKNYSSIEELLKALEGGE